MKNEASKIILFSGRFDPPHLGHIDTITKLGKRYQEVLIVVLDHKSQFYPIELRVKTLETILSRCLGNYTVVSNDSHFGNILKMDAELFNFDVYGSGNAMCTDHMRHLGFEVELVPRNENYCATDDRAMQKIKKVIEEEYGFTF